MSSKQLWDEFSQSVRAGDVDRASAVFSDYREARRAEGRRTSRPILVNLSSKRLPYPNAVPVSKIPSVMKKSPEFTKLIQRVVSKRG